MSDPLARHLKLVEQYPGNEMARFSLGKAYFDLGNFAEAKTHLEMALAKRADWMVVVILLGKCELSRGNPVAAKGYFERARRLAIEQDHEGPREEMEVLLAELKERETSVTINNS